MSNNDWIQEGTPRDEEWTAEQDDYGVPVEPAEWDDYASEQTVPVPPAPSQPAPELVPAEEHDEPADEWESVETERVVAGDAQPAAESFEEAEPAVDEVEPSAVEPDAAVDEGEPFPGEPEPGVTEEEQPAGEAEVVVAEEPSGGEPGLVDEQEWTVEEPAAAQDGDETQTPPALEDEWAAEEPMPVPSGDTEPVDAEPAAVVDDEETPAVVDDQETPAEEAGAAASFGWPVRPEPGEDAAEDPQATQAMPLLAPAPAAVAAGAAGTAALAGLYRGDRDQTRVIDPSQRQSLDDEMAEEERVAHQLRAEKEARDQRLGLVQTSDANAVRHLPQGRRGVGHFGSFGLFVLRLVTAAILGVVGYQVLSALDATTEFLGRTLIPEPELVAWIVGIGLAVMAVLLLIGLAVRVVGVLLVVVAAGSLAFIRWGQFSPFVAGMEGFLGDLDLLLFAVGIVFLSLGGGRWGIDGAFVKARENAREARH
ncbi:DoxX family protein [Tessaracoccus sp. G1721]